MLLSERLSLLRKQRKMTLDAVSKRCGCGLAYLHKLEKGIIKRPKLELLYKLAAFYQFCPDTLILEAEKIPEDVYWRIIHTPKLLTAIRNYKI